MFAKLVNGYLVEAPKTLNVNGLVHYHPSDKTYLECGYLPVIETQPPEFDEEEPKQYKASYVEENGEIRQVWVEYEPELKAKPLSEIEILRQRIEALTNADIENGQAITDLELETIEQGQAITDLELMILGGMENV